MGANLVCLLCSKRKLVQRQTLRGEGQATTEAETRVMELQVKKLEE